MQDHYDIAIIGGGIVGLSTARAIRRAAPELRLVLIEKESGVGRHQTGHNSGVIHAGLYYQPGSLKARLCAEGRAAMLDYCERHDLLVERCGKLVVATQESEIEPLRELQRRGFANGIDTLDWIDAAGISKLEPEITGVAALLVPTTAITDFGRVCEELARGLEAERVELLLGDALASAAHSAAGWRLRVGATEISAQRVIACGGLQSDRLSRALGLAARIRVVPIRGEYHCLAGGLASRVTRCIYPVPDPSLPFLGVHLTPRLDRSVLVGPNAIFAMAREGYQRWDLSLKDLWSAASYLGSWRLLWRHRGAAWAEMRRAASREATAADLRRLMPAVNAADLKPAPSGIRAQAVGIDGALIHDFAIEENDHAMAVLNAPSPAATASLAIGQELAGRALQRWSM